MSLTEPTDIPNWVLASASLATVIVAGLPTLFKLKPAQEFHALHTAGLALFSMVLGVTLVINQGTIVRVDLVETIYARWAFLVAINALFGFMIASALKIEGMPRRIITCSLGLGAAAYLLASLSTEGRIWFHFSVGLALHLVASYCIVAFPKAGGNPENLSVVNSPANTSTSIMILKGSALFVTAPYAIFLGLGQSAGNVITPLVETWVYVSLDIAKLALCLAMTYIYAPKLDTLSNDKLAGEKNF